MKIDDDFMKKIQKLKENYEKQKEKATSLEREDIKKQLQIEILVKRVHDIDAKKNEFKSELLETKRQNLKLRKAKAQAEIQLDDLTDQFEKGDVLGMHKDGRQTLRKAANEMHLAHRNKKIKDIENQ